MKTEFNSFPFSETWRRLKNHCRTTDNKDFTDKNPTDTFKKKLLMSEHTPIRLLEFDWSWKGIPYWVSTEWSRHKFEKFISSQRDDRLIDDIPRAEKPQATTQNQSVTYSTRTLPRQVFLIWIQQKQSYSMISHWKKSMVQMKPIVSVELK